MATNIAPVMAAPFDQPMPAWVGAELIGHAEIIERAITRKADIIS